MLILLCFPAAASHAPQVGVRIGEASNPGPGLNGFDVAEPDWSDHESDDEGELALDGHLEEWYADWLVDPSGSNQAYAPVEIHGCKRFPCMSILDHGHPWNSIFRYPSVSVDFVWLPTDGGDEIPKSEAGGKVGVEQIWGGPTRS